MDAVSSNFDYNPVRERGLRKFKTSQGIEGQYMSNLCVHCNKPIGLDIGETILVKDERSEIVPIEISCSSCASKKRRSVDSSDSSRLRDKAIFDQILAKIMANRKLTPEEAKLLRSKKMKVPESFIEQGTVKDAPGGEFKASVASNPEEGQEDAADPNVEVSKELDKMEQSEDKDAFCPF